MQRTSRRTFLRSSALAATIPCFRSVARSVVAQSAAIERISVGVIGVGSRGFNLIDDLLHCGDAQIVAVCDVDREHYRDRPWGKGVRFGRNAAAAKIEGAYAAGKKSGQRTDIAKYSDYRELCAREDLDAVIVATPDHWHYLCSVEAIAQGKDVYCEKPVTHTFREGLLLNQQVAAKAAIFQTGSQQRSDPLFRRCVEIVRNGHLGNIQRIEVGLPPGYPEPPGDPDVATPPEHLDYDFWCGPAPKLPYRRATHHRWWRAHRAFGGGVLMDWIGHHNDIAQWGIGAERTGPTRVTAVDWKYPTTDVVNTPQDFKIVCDYPHGIQSSISSTARQGVQWIGDEGKLFVTRGKAEASDPQWLKDSFDPGPVEVYNSPGHMRNFLDGIKQRAECVAPADIAHRSITPGHLGYVSDQLRRPLEWDSEKQEVVGDSAANDLLLNVNYRLPWKLSS